MRRKGFTLIELLVVIAIIAILAAILFPVFTKAKNKANQAKCMNNMVQLGKAVLSYADDYQGNTPLAYSATWDDWDNGTWRQRIQPYCKSKAVLLCPVPVKDWESGHFNAGTKPKDVSHYGINVNMTTTDDGATYRGYSRLGSAAVPSQTILISENKDGDWSAEPWDEDGHGTDNGGFWPYHGDKDLNKLGTFVFCDGHATVLTVERTQATISGVKFYYWKKIKK